MKISFIPSSWHIYDPFSYSLIGAYYATILKSQLGNKAKIVLLI